MSSIIFQNISTNGDFVSIVLSTSNIFWVPSKVHYLINLTVGPGARLAPRISSMIAVVNEKYRFKIGNSYFLMNFFLINCAS